MPYCHIPCTVTRCAAFTLFFSVFFDCVISVLIIIYHHCYTIPLLFVSMFYQLHVLQIVLRLKIGDNIILKHTAKTNYLHRSEMRSCVYRSSIFFWFIIIVFNHFTLLIFLHLIIHSICHSLTNSTTHNYTNCIHCYCSSSFLFSLLDVCYMFHTCHTTVVIVAGFNV